MMSSAQSQSGTGKTVPVTETGDPGPDPRAHQSEPSRYKCTPGCVEVKSMTSTHHHGNTRSHDMWTCRLVSKRAVRMLFLDEACQMLGHGFTDIIYKIFYKLPTNVHAVPGSSTEPADIMEVYPRSSQNYH